MIYGASNIDLAQGYGSNAHALTLHYLDHGADEGRATSGFNALVYGATYVDLAKGYGSDAHALLLHYLDHGADEGRVTKGFDSVAYLLTYADLGAANLGANWALTHWLDHGADEGRIGDAAFGREQSDQVLGLADGVQSGTLTTSDRDWYALKTRANQTLTLELNGALSDGTLQVFDVNGHLLRSTTAAPGAAQAALSFTATGQEAYVVVSGPTAGDFVLQVHAGDWWL